MTSRNARAVVLSLAVGALVASSAAGSAATTTSRSGPLSVAYRYTLTHAVTSQYRVPLVTEASDGSVFYVSGMTVYEVASHHSTTVAAQVGKKVVALAASPTLLIVETRSAVLAYDPSTATQRASWPIKETGSFLPDLDVAHGVVWSLTDPATDESGAEPGAVNELRLGEPAKLITSNAASTAPVTDPAGDVFFATFPGRIERVTPGDSTRTSSLRKFADAPLAYADGKLLAEIDGEKTIDDVLNPSTLALISSNPGHSGDYYGLANTTIGALSLSINCGPTAYCSEVDVRRIRSPDKRGAALSVPWGAAVMGPDATVLAIPHGGPPQLVGLK